MLVSGFGVLLVQTYYLKYISLLSVSGKNNNNNNNHHLCHLTSSQVTWLSESTVLNKLSK